MRASPAPLLILMLACMPGGAVALEDDQLRLDGGLGWSCWSDGDRSHGVYMNADGAWIFDPFWALRVGVDVAEHRSTDSIRLYDLAVGVRYQLDVFEYVPWVDVSPGAYFASGEDAPAAFAAGMGAAFGIDRLIDRDWLVGAQVRFHQLFGVNDRFPAWMNVGLRVGYRWTLGDPFAP